MIDHKVQFSNSGTYFNYREQGGQDVLFPVQRFSLEYEWNKRNTLVFLYQPLRLESQVLLEDDLIVDDLIYPEGSSVKLLYTFPFYRLSYLRELFADHQKYKFSIGGSLQIRNATISFESAVGSLFRTNRDVGLVPAFKLKSRAQLNEKFYLEFEADGIYAPVSYLNGSDNEVTGAILDASFNLSSIIITMQKSIENAIFKADWRRLSELSLGNLTQKMVEFYDLIQLKAFNDNLHIISM